MKVPTSAGRVFGKNIWVWMLVGNAVAWAAIVASGWEVAATFTH